MSQPTLIQQQRRRQESLVRAYQTYYLFRTRRLEKLGLKVITFLGIAVPLISGGLIQTLYEGGKPPTWLLAGSGLVGLTLTVLSLWAVIDHWDEKAQMSRSVVEKFRTLVTDLERLAVNPDGLYDEERLRQLEYLSYEGRRPDDDFDVSERAKRKALEIAKRKYPPLTT